MVQMTQLMTEHPLRYIPDYANDLLSPDLRQQIERHLWVCPECRQALKSERDFETLARQTLQAATQPDWRRLATLRPPAPVRRGISGVRLYRQFAPVTVIALMFVLGLIIHVAGEVPFQQSFGPALIVTYGSPTMTATATNTPTATLAALPAGQDTNQAKPVAPAPIQTMAVVEPDAKGAGQNLSFGRPDQVAASPEPNATPPAMPAN